MNEQESNSSKQECGTCKSMKNSFLLVYVLILLSFFAVSYYVFSNYQTETFRIITKYHEENISIVKSLQQCPSGEKAQVAENTENENYNEFLAKYYSIQGDWLNRWLAILGVLLTFIGIMLPLFFMRYYSEKKDDFEKLEQKMNASIAKMEKAVDDVNRYKEVVKNNIDSYKEERDKMISQMADYLIKIKESEMKVKKIEKNIDLKQLSVEAFKLAAEQNHDECIEKNKEILKIDAKNIKAMEGIAFSYYHKKNFVKSFEWCDKILKFDSKNTSASFIASTYYYYKKYYQESIKYGQMSLEGHPDFIHGLKNIALCYYYLDDYDNSIKYLEKCLTQYPHSRLFLKYIALCYEKKGENIKAIEFYKKLIHVKKSKLSLINMLELLIKSQNHDESLDYLKYYLDQYEINAVYKKKWIGILSKQAINKKTQELIDTINEKNNYDTTN